MKKYFLVFLLLASSVTGNSQSSQVDSWKTVKANGRGTIVMHWYESQPFVFRNTSGMSGIEYELVEDFRKFLKTYYKVDVHIVWLEGKSFGDTYETVKNAKVPGVFGVSAFSITPERERDVAFSKSYMSDISVMITSKNIPVVQSREEFNRVFAKLTAVTIKATTYEQDILKLQREGGVNFKIEYIPSTKNILRAVEERDSAFAFIDLPVYMQMFANEPSVDVKRQNLFPVKRQGHGFIFSKDSDWQEPLDAYFASVQFKRQLEEIISHYIDLELYHFIESLAIESTDMVVLLTKEKEIQYNDLIGKTEQIKKDARARTILILLVSVTFVSLGIIGIMYHKRNQQKEQIERQRQSIELKKEQLEKRNHHLVALDEEKNNLIKILAHDLRTPINHVQGLAQIFLLSNSDLKEEDRLIIQKISDASVRLNKMITNILDIDSIENNRVKIFMDRVSPGPMLMQVVKSFEKQAARKEITIRFNQMCDPMIEGDSLFLIQVFENLISNALKFSDKGKSIDVSMEERDDSVVIAIRDEGPGLTEEDKSLLFRKFQRLSAKPTDGENSTGLGLSIVKKYVELMKGTVWCESEVGKGAVFLLRFKTIKDKVALV
ncbi:MAG TPA: ATP-binding protein [Chryseosolibacter sp.]